MECPVRSKVAFKQQSNTYTLHNRRHVRCRASVSEQQQQQQQQDSAAAASIRQLLTRRSFAPPRYVGPVEVSRVPGKRFGLTATRHLAVGELLLVTPPLAVAFGPAGDAPSNDDLLQQLDGAQLEPWQANWLRALHREDPHTTPADAAATAADVGAQQQQQQQQQQQEQGDPTSEQQQLRAAAAALQEVELAAAEEKLLPRLQRLLLLGSDAGQPTSSSTAVDALSPAAAAAAAVGGDLSIASVRCPLTAEQLQQVVSGNAYSESAEDLGGALLRELDPEAVTGLWPEYALLNHSCVPNTLATCVGRYLLLHVTASVLQGEELTCSYLGGRTFSPVGVRRAYMQGVYGFHCVCQRCVAEQRTFPTQYYPADDAVPGLSSSSSSSSSSSTARDGDGDGQGLVGSVLGSVRGAVGWLTGRQQGGGEASDRPNPSAQHRLLLQQYEAVQQELQPAVQAAATADSRRQEQQLQLLAQVTAAVEELLDVVSAAVAGDALLAGQEAAACKWLAAAAYPLLQLQLELLELLLSSGDLPVDESQLLLDEAYGGSSSGSSRGSQRSSNGRGMSAAGAAAAARYALNPGSKRQQPRNVPGWLAVLWGVLQQRDQQQGGQQQPVTKRQLLGLYAESLGRALGVLDAVARGSDAHVVAAIKHMDAVRQCEGPEAEATVLAEGQCSRAHAARYGVARGAEGQALLVRLISARRRQLLGASLARKMSVLAWEAATTRG